MLKYQNWYMHIYLRYTYAFFFIYNLLFFCQKTVQVHELNNKLSLLKVKSTVKNKYLFMADKQSESFNQ